MKRLIVVTAVAAAVVLGAGQSFAQELTVDQIVEKANLVAYYPAKDGTSDVRMTITDSQGRTRLREFKILRFNINPGGEQKYYVYFHKPADVAHMVYLVWKHPDRDDDRWLYLPAMDLVKRVAAGDKRSSFAGSHFVYEDVSGRSLAADTHELVESGEGRYKIKNIPRDAKGSEFAYYFAWIDAGTFMPLKAEYYDKTGTLIRAVETMEVQKIGGYPTAVKTKAKDFIRNGETVMEFSNIAYDAGLSDDVFTERYLRMPPAQWVQ